MISCPNNMFKENKYTKFYFQIIERSKEREVNGYVERHHILPKSLGGSNESKNIAVLTAREHYICHWLLTKMVKDKDALHKMSCAFFYTCFGTNKQDKKYSAKEYERSRTIMAKEKLGRRNSPEAHRKTYEKGFLIKWNGSEEQKQHLSKLYKGRKFSDEHKKNISLAKQKNPFPKGNPMDKEEFRIKVSESKIGLKGLVKDGKRKMAIPNSEKWINLINSGWISK